MLVVACGGLLPVLLALIVLVRLLDPRGSGARRPGARPGIPAWEQASREIAARGVAVHRCRSDAALRRRHLASVLPGDARR